MNGWCLSKLACIKRSPNQVNVALQISRVPFTEQHRSLMWHKTIGRLPVVLAYSLLLFMVEYTSLVYSKYLSILPLFTLRRGGMLYKQHIWHTAWLWHAIYYLCYTLHAHHCSTDLFPPARNCKHMCSVSVGLAEEGGVHLSLPNYSCLESMLESCVIRWHL